MGDRDCAQGVDREEFINLALMYGDLFEINEATEGGDEQNKAALLVESLFEKYDKENKGYLNEEEFASALATLEENGTLNKLKELNI